MTKDWFTEVRVGQEGTYYNDSRYWTMIVMEAKGEKKNKQVDEAQQSARRNTLPRINEMINTFEVYYQKPIHAIENFPKPAALIKGKFTLKTPYISKDDDEMYFLDNPVIKEPVYQVPYINSTSWKGMLRHACFQTFWRSRGVDLQNSATVQQFAKTGTSTEVDQHRLQILNLFGQENDHMELIWSGIYHDLGFAETEYEEKRKLRMRDSEGLQGRLRFYSSFFTAPSGGQSVLDYVVINPLDPLKRNSKHGPITIEVVAAGASAEVGVLYFPYDLILRYGQLNPVTNLAELQEIKAEVMRDLKLAATGFRTLFYKNAISAKGKADFGKCTIDSFDVQCELLEADEIAAIKAIVLSQEVTQ